MLMIYNADLWPKGWGPGSLSETIQTLSDVFTPLSDGRDERYEALFVLQEITRIILAFDLCTEAVDNSPTTKLGDIYALDPVQDLATWILERILSLLNRFEQFERNVSHPAAAWQHFIAFFDRGPLRFGDYYYLYGLLDCATQLGKILEEAPSPFEDRMREIVRSSKDPSLRWKAVSLAPHHILLASYSYLSAIPSNGNSNRSNSCSLPTE